MFNVNGHGEHCQLTSWAGNGHLGDTQHRRPGRLRPKYDEKYIEFLHQSKDTGFVTIIEDIAPGNIANAQCNNTLARGGMYCHNNRPLIALVINCNHLARKK